MFRELGLWVYKTGLRAAVLVFKTMPPIGSIYTKTFFDDNFVVGESDLDLALVAADLPLEEEVEFLKTYHRRSLLIRLFFPFLSDVELFYGREFDRYQKLTHAEINYPRKHFKDWRLVYGSDRRARFEGTETQPSPFVLRDAFENMLLNAYESALVNEKNFRRLHKFTLAIVRASFINQGKGDARDADEYKVFLKNKNFDGNFVESLFGMPRQDYRASRELITQSVYCCMRLLDECSGTLNETNNFSVVGGGKRAGVSVPEETSAFVDALGKTSVKSIYLTPIPLKKDASYLYIILDDTIEYPQFKNFFDSLLENLGRLSQLSDEVGLKINNRFAQDFRVFPIILTEKMLSGILVDGFYPMESVAFNKLGVRLYGADASMTEDYGRIKASFERLTARLVSVYGVKNILLPRLIRPEEKNKAVLAHLMAHRLLKEKKIACLSGARQEYAKHFKDLAADSGKVGDQYALARRINALLID